MKISKDEAIKILSRYDNEYYTPATRQAHRMGAEALRYQMRVEDDNELVKCLRICAAQESSSGDCCDCPRWEKSCGSRHCVDDVMLEAASAIESQQQRIDKLKAEKETLCRIVKFISDCTHCKYVARNVAEEPCNDCHERDGYPYWEWNGAVPEVDNGV